MMLSIVPEQLTAADLQVITGMDGTHLALRGWQEAWAFRPHAGGFLTRPYYTATLPSDVRALVMHHYRRIRLARGRA